MLLLHQYQHRDDAQISEYRKRNIGSIFHHHRMPSTIMEEEDETESELQPLQKKGSGGATLRRRRSLDDMSKHAGSENMRYRKEAKPAHEPSLQADVLKGGLFPGR